MIIVIDLKIKSLTFGPTLPDRLFSGVEIYQRGGTALLDYKLHLKDYPQNTMLSVLDGKDVFVVYGKMHLEKMSSKK